MGAYVAYSCPKCGNPVNPLIDHCKCCGWDAPYKFRTEEEPAMCETEYNISITWSVEDVKTVAPDLTYDEMCQVLDLAADNHDANYGISWETLRIYADDVREAR